MTHGALFDVDGTLVDTNFLHAVAWADAFRAHGHVVATSDLLALIGQGSERLVDSVLGHGDDAIVDAHSDIYGARLHQLCAFDGAADLLRRCKSAGLTVVLATSASEHEAEHLQQAIGAADAVDHVTSKADADESKPAPDIVEAALEAAGLAAPDCLFIGDTVWDVEAAKRAGMDCVCVQTGGIAPEALRQAGAVEIYPSVGALLADFDGSPLAALSRRTD